MYIQFSIHSRQETQFIIKVSQQDKSYRKISRKKTAKNREQNYDEIWLKLQNFISKALRTIYTFIPPALPANDMQMNSQHVA